MRSLLYNDFVVRLVTFYYVALRVAKKTREKKTKIIQAEEIKYNDISIFISVD